MHLEPIAFSVLLLAAVAACGLALGSIRIGGVGLGSAGVLFAGILIAQLKPPVDMTLLGFARDFGLILFVYMTGMQVGRGFLASLRKQGWSLNLLSASVVLGGAALTAMAAAFGMIDIAAAIGIFSGATTNTPSLGAAQEALKAAMPNDPARVQLSSLGYALSYPFGVIGIICSILLVRLVFRVNPIIEAQSFHGRETGHQPPLQRMAIRVTNPSASGRTLGDIPSLSGLGVTISRIKRVRTKQVVLANPQTQLQEQDILLAVGTAKGLKTFQEAVGEISQDDLTQGGALTLRRIVVTRPSLVGMTLHELNFPQTYAVTVTRLSRADIEMSARADLRLEFGDILHMVGEEKALAKVAETLGNSIKDLSQTNLLPIFIGMAVGILLGLAPIHVPGLPAPVRLGLAGGPLLVAIVISRLGKIGPLVCYVPPSATTALRDLGLVLFLGSVGIKAGEHFMQALLSGDGLRWIAWGAAVTIIPLLTVAAFARVVLKMNFVPLCGLMAGSMTDPPALAFANAMSRSDAPSVAYATVYPATMLMRILAAQILVLIFCH